MDLLVLTGFLGSGKTTLLVKLVRLLRARGWQNIAVIENEVGQVGIDDVVLKEDRLQVREIYSGCICCSLRMDLIQTLLALEREIRPDLVVLEPSGVAGPRQVLSALQGYSGEIDSITVVTVLDAVRFQRLSDLSIPFIKDGIDIADLIAVNKADAVDEAELIRTRERLQAQRKGAPVAAVSALNGENLDALVDVIQARRDAGIRNRQPCETVTECAGHTFNIGPKPAVISFQIDHAFDPPVARENIEQGLRAFFTDVTDDMRVSGCTLIGHIKVIVKQPRTGYLLASVTDFDHPVGLNGCLAPSCDSIKATVNIIAYAMNTDEVEPRVRQYLKERLLH